MNLDHVNEVGSSFFFKKKTKQGELNVDLANCRIRIDELESATVEKLLDDQALSIIKICGDWLKSNPNVITASAQVRFLNTFFF